jgi:hypothetical protein
MSFSDWEENKMSHNLDMLINFIFKDVYRIGETQLVKFLVDLDLAKSSKYKEVFTSVFLVACICIFKEDDVIKIIESHGFQFLDNELENSTTGRKLKFISTLDNDCIDRLMPKVASIFIENNYKSTTDELFAKGNNPLVYSNNNTQGFLMVRIYTSVILMNVLASDNKISVWHQMH